MRRLAGRLRRRLMGLAEDAAPFDSAAFRAAPEATRQLLGDRGAGLREGFNAGLELPTVAELVAFAEDTASERRLFRFEGAAMACALLDLVPVPGSTRWARLMAARGSTRGHVLGIGRGWAYGALGRLPRTQDPEPPDTAGAAWEGLGFHDALFGRIGPTGRGSAAYLHGAGRALWFLGGADAEQVATLLAAWSLPASDIPHVWSGTAFAATLVGGADDLGRVGALGGGATYAGSVSAIAITARAGPPPHEMQQRARALGAPDWPECLARDIEALATSPATAHLRRIRHLTPPPAAAPEPGPPAGTWRGTPATTTPENGKERTPHHAGTNACDV